MNEIDQRQALEQLIRSHGSDYSALSRLLGRNPAYIHQFITRGSPRKLAEQDRKVLAEFFGVDEEVLGGPPRRSTKGDAGSLVTVPRFDLGASAGSGAFADEERPVAQIGFDPAWLRRITRGRPADLSIIKVEGDSMTPTLADGDDILVNRADAFRSLRDGIYVLRRDDTLMVKRIALSPAAGRITIRSDNEAYPSWDGIELAGVDIIGRVIWAGRRLD